MCHDSATKILSAGNPKSDHNTGLIIRGEIK